MEYYSAIRKNEIMPFSAIWIDLEIIILSEIRKKQLLCDSSYMWNLKKYKSTYFQNRNRLMNKENKFMINKGEMCGG